MGWGDRGRDERVEGAVGWDVGRYWGSGDGNARECGEGVVCYYGGTEGDAGGGRGREGEEWGGGSCLIKEIIAARRVGTVLDKEDAMFVLEMYSLMHAKLSHSVGHIVTKKYISVRYPSAAPHLDHPLRKPGITYPNHNR